MKQGFETADGKRVDVETAFKNPEHPFRVAIVCAMWLTGFDVECLSTLYIDKPMKAHTLMQAIARANRVYPGKDFGLIVDYNGMLKSLREALAQYALGDESGGGEEIVAPIEERVKALLAAIEETEKHLRGLGFDADALDRRERLRAHCRRSRTRWTPFTFVATNAKRRFEILARQVFIRFKALIMEPAAFAYAERHDNIEAIYKKLEERRDTADVTDLLKELHRIVNEAIRAAEPGEDQMDAKTLRSEPDRSGKAARRVRQEGEAQGVGAAGHPADGRRRSWRRCWRSNPLRMDYYKKYSEIVADYNREKDRVTIEETFARLVDFCSGLDAEQHRAAEEGLSEDEYALFCLLQKENISQSRPGESETGQPRLLDSLRKLIAPARTLDGKGTNAGRGRGVHSRQPLPDAAHAAIHRRGKGVGGQAGLSARLAAERERLICKLIGAVFIPGYMSKARRKLKRTIGKSAKRQKPRKAKFITRAEARRRAARHVLNRMFKGATVRDGAEAGGNLYNRCGGKIPGWCIKTRAAAPCGLRTWW